MQHMTEWLEPSIASSIQRTMGVCCENEESVAVYGKLKAIMNQLKKSLPEDSHYLIYEIEDSYNSNSRISIGLSYREGFNDGLNLAADSFGVKKQS